MSRLWRGNTDCNTAAGWSSWMDRVSGPRNPKSFGGQTEQAVRLVFSWAVCWAISNKAIGTQWSLAYAIDAGRHAIIRLGVCSTTGLAARSGLGYHGGGDSGCWFSMVRRRTLRGAGGGVGKCGGWAKRGKTVGSGSRTNFGRFLFVNGDFLEALFLRRQLRFVLTRSCKPTAFLAVNAGWRSLPPASRPLAGCVKTQKMVSFSEHLLNFKTLLQLLQDK